jgi:hypothetical protein
MARIELQLAQSVVGLGETVQGVLVAELDHAVKARGIRLLWQGLEETHIRVSHGKHSTTYRERQVWVSREIGFVGDQQLETQGPEAEEELNRLLGEREPAELPPGTQRYDFAFAVPEGAPPSYAGTHTDVAYTLQARIDIPIWRDVRAAEVITVLAPAGEPSRESGAVGTYPPPEGRPSFVQDVLAPFRPDIQMELRLDQAEVCPGGTLTGQVSFQNHSNRRVRRILVDLCEMEYARASRYERCVPASLRSGTDLPVSDLSGLSPTEFQLPVPPEFTPDWEGVYSRLFHPVRARLDVAWAADIWAAAPVRVVGGAR